LKSATASLLVALVARAPAAALEVPDARLTPGAIGSSDPAIVCVALFVHGAGAGRLRAAAFRFNVFRTYGILRERWRGYTIDHLYGERAAIELVQGAAPPVLRRRRRSRRATSCRSARTPRGLKPGVRAGR